MDELAKQAILSVLRNLATPLIVAMAATGYISTSEATSFVVAGVAIVASVAWGLANKYLFVKKLNG